MDLAEVVVLVIWERRGQRRMDLVVIGRLALGAHREPPRTDLAVIELQRPMAHSGRLRMVSAGIGQPHRKERTERLRTASAEPAQWLPTAALRDVHPMVSAAPGVPATK